MEEVWKLLTDGRVVAAIIGAVAGGLIVWRKNATEIKKLREETRKLVAETVKNHGELLKNEQDRRKEYNDATVRCEKVATALIGLLQGDGDLAAIDEQRELFCGCVMNEVVARFLDWVEFECLRVHSVGKGEADRYSAIITHSLLELKRHKKWLDTINHPNLLKHLSREPARIARRTFSPLEKIVLEFPVAIQTKERERIEETLTQIVGYVPPAS